MADRFLSQDPTGFSGEDSNLYRFSYNESTDYVDINGKNPIVLWWLLAGAAAAVGLSGCGSSLAPNNSPVVKNPQSPPDKPHLGGDSVPYSVPNFPANNPASTIWLIGPPHVQADGTMEPDDTYGTKINYLNSLGVPAQNIFFYNGPADLQQAANQAAALNLTAPSLYLWGHGGPGVMGVGYSPGVRQPVTTQNAGQVIAPINTIKPTRVTILACNIAGKVGNVDPSLIDTIQQGTGVPVSGTVGLEAPWFEGTTPQWLLQKGGGVYTSQPN